MHEMLRYCAEGMYYFLALGWLLLLVAGLVVICFRNWRRAGLVMLAVGVMWVGFHFYMEWSHAAKYRRVEERFDRVEKGMTEADVRRILGEPTEQVPAIATGGLLWDSWLYWRRRWMSHPVADWPYWRIEPFRTPETELHRHGFEHGYVISIDAHDKVVRLRGPKEGESAPE